MSTAAAVRVMMMYLVSYVHTPQINEHDLRRLIAFFLFSVEVQAQAKPSRALSTTPRVSQRQLKRNGFCFLVVSYISYIPWGRFRQGATLG